MPHTEYVLTRRVKLRLQGWGRRLTCLVCNQPLEVGQKIHSIKSGPWTKRYHKECWEQLLH